MVVAGGGLRPKNKDISFELQKVEIHTGTAILARTVEVADTPERWEHGLMHRHSLEGIDGMLFLFADSAPRFMWMKNTRIPLDMLFFDGQGRVVHVVRDTVPYSEEIIPSKHPATGVLELPAGSARVFGIEIGDRIDVSPHS